MAEDDLKSTFTISAIHDKKKSNYSNYYYSVSLFLPLSVIYLRNLIASFGYHFSIDINIQIVPKMHIDSDSPG